MVDKNTAQSNDEVIIKQGCRVLQLRNWYKMREKLNTTYQIIGDVLLCTGMRVEEFWELVDHPGWFNPNRRCIDLPKGSIGKTRCKLQERTILLTNEGVAAVQELINHTTSIKYIDRSNMRKVLIKAAISAGLDSKGIMPKMFRKMAVSFLMNAVIEKEPYILASIGHSAETRDRHYLAMGFATRDQEDIKKFFKGWGS